ncbi:MAG: hypothetical protein BGO67_01315 [Alphaproteobacteria bacterium 41-28]|nr:MAG: hypothetical protein BGO67_01315 [Alphaproteobacteria bacterium 41-28]
MRKLLFVLLLVSVPTQYSHSVQTPTPSADEEALRKGSSATSVCFIRFIFGEGEIFDGSGVLVKENIVATAAHNAFADEDSFEDDKKIKKKYKKFVRELRRGNAQRCSAFITFAPNAYKAISDFEESPTLENLSVFYEADSIIIDPHYKEDNTRNDIAFVKLKRSVEGIEPLPLYEEGIIPPSKLKIHDEKDPDMEILMHGDAYGYGQDVYGEFGKKRGVYQPCFLGISTTQESDSDDSDEEDNGQILNVEPSIPITAYFPCKREDHQETSIIMDEITHKFHDILFEHINKEKKGENLGILMEGDSGGPLVVSGRVVGIQSESDIGRDLQEKVKDFLDMPTTFRVCETRFAPLFNYQTGALLSHIPVMIEKLESFPTTPESKLEDLILTVKRLKEFLRQESPYLLTDLENLLKEAGEENNTADIFEKFVFLQKKYSKWKLEDLRGPLEARDFQLCRSLVKSKTDKFQGIKN